MAELFPPTGRTPASTRDLATAIAVARAKGAAELAILCYGPGAEMSPWFCFDVGADKYAIWRATGDLYAADAMGAVGDDPLPPPISERLP